MGIIFRASVFCVAKKEKIREDTNHGGGLGCLLADNFSVFSVLPLLKQNPQKSPDFGIGAKLIVNRDVINVRDLNRIHLHLYDRMALPSTHRLFFLFC